MRRLDELLRASVAGAFEQACSATQLRGHSAWRRIASPDATITALALFTLSTLPIGG
jgi:hypothetical protein